LGEKLAAFIKFENEILRPYGLRMTEKTKACNYLIRHSERSEESHAFIEFFTRRIKEIIYKTETVVDKP
jgi:hypothetical protein